MFFVIKGWTLQSYHVTRLSSNASCNVETNERGNVETNERGLRLLEFATFNNLVLTNTLGPHKPSNRWTWQSPDRKHHKQNLGEKCFWSGVNIHRTRSFPGADIGSDHDLVMMNFWVCLKKARKSNKPRQRFDLEKLRDPDVACTFQAKLTSQ